MPDYEYPKYQLKIRADSPPRSDLDWELYAYRVGHPPEQGGLGRAGHFKQIVNMLWGNPKGAKHFVWHPWAEKMNARVHEHPTTGQPYPHLAISGPTSCGKTDFLAVYALINWLCAPIDTLVLCTSTDLKAARKRIWGSVVEYYQSAKRVFPGKLTDSMGILRTDDGSGVFSDKRGIALVAGEKKAELDAMGKLIGAKNKRVFLLADELAELTQALLDTAFSNLSGNPFYQIVAASNFKSRLDPFGVLYAPKDGYDLVDTLNEEEWETERGWAVHFDGLKSPNITGGKDEWPIYGSKQLANHRKDLGENTSLFYRFCRSAEPPMGIDNTIYSDSDFSVGQAYQTPVWLEGFTTLAAADPAYTNGGDRFILYYGKFGMTTDGIAILCYDGFDVLREDVRLAKVRLRSYQMADQIKEKCAARGIKPQHFGMDTTASGSALADVVGEEWSHDIYRVDFSGAATERAVTADGVTAREKYCNRVSELWYVGKEFMKYGQIRGLVPSTAREMKARMFESIKGADGHRIKVEEKPKMKLRLTFSPDEADAAFVLLDLARARLGFMPSGLKGTTQSNSSWKRRAAELNEVYEDTPLIGSGVSSEFY